MSKSKLLVRFAIALAGCLAIVGSVLVWHSISRAQALENLTEEIAEEIAEEIGIADELIVYKKDRRLLLKRDDEVLKEYEVSLGQTPIGHKKQQGDSRTPEGKYVVDWRNAKSKFHLSLHISYPNQADRAQAHARGVSPGGSIMIHGLPNGMGKLENLFKGRDWTDGCIAVTSAEIEEIWAAVPDGTPIEIFP